MNKEAKKEVLKAIGQKTISKVEARQLLQTDGIILLDLSSQGINPSPIESLLEKIPNLKIQFSRKISLGHGKKPDQL